MAIEKPKRRMTLRDLLIYVEKYGHTVREHYRATVSTSLADLRAITQPRKKPGHYPTLRSIHNSLDKFQETTRELLEMADYLQERLEEVKQELQR